MEWSRCTGQKIKIAIIDSGVNARRKEFTGINIKLLNDCDDKIGHGTAVSSIISRTACKASLYCYGLFEKDGVVDTHDLIEALENITSKQFYNIIHLSCGVVAYELSELYAVCKKITDKGTIIVSAFDNEGVISYPAAFDNVIGVDWTRYCSDGMSYFFVENSPINILGLGSLQRLPWLNEEYKYVAGASFAAPYITGIIAKMLEFGIKPINILDALRKNAERIIVIDNKHYKPFEQELEIKKAILFPYNKEIQTLSIFEDMLKFQVKGIYDLPIFRNTGKTCKEILEYGSSERIIQSFNDILWQEDFDTIILGHVDVVSRVVKTNIIKDVIEKCIKFKKNIYAFDDLRPYEILTKEIFENGQFAFFPKVDFCDVDKKLMGKLYSIATPVLAIFGTSSKQGKFSLQLIIRKKMQQLGYKVGGLGTEPTALLFGMDRVYPIGYESVCIQGEEAVKTINRYMHEIDEKLYDIIITGSQSQTIPYNILLTNAFESYCAESKEKYIDIVLRESADNLIIEVSNVSEELTSSEIENIFREGYSSKGKNRGIGLARVKELVAKVHADIIVGNRLKETQNWVCFKLVIPK